MEHKQAQQQQQAASSSAAAMTDASGSGAISAWMDQHAPHIIQQWLQQHASDIGAQMQAAAAAGAQQSSAGLRLPPPLRLPSPQPPGGLTSDSSPVDGMMSPQLQQQQQPGAPLYSPPMRIHGGRHSPSGASTTSTPSPVSSARPLGPKALRSGTSQRFKGPLADVRHQSAMTLSPGEEPAATSAAREAAVTGSASPPHGSVSASRRHSGGALGLGSLMSVGSGGSSSGGGSGSGGSSVPSSVLQLPTADVLLVEDVRVTQKVNHAALTRAHYRVEIADSGEMALDKYRALVSQAHSQLRIVLMDISLPGMNGVEATRRIRSLEAEAAAQAAAAGLSPPAPVWIYGLTATVDPEDLARYERAGMNGCILKGKVLSDCVRTAVKESERDSRAFVNLATQHHASSASGAGGSPKAGPDARMVPQSMPMPMRHVATRTTGVVDANEGSATTTPSVPMQVSAPGSPATSIVSRSNSPLVTGGGTMLSAPDFNMLRMASPSPGLRGPSRSPPSLKQQQPQSKRVGAGADGSAEGNANGNGNGSQYSGTKRSISAMHDKDVAAVRALTGSSTATPAPWSSSAPHATHPTPADASVSQSGGPNALLVEDVRVAQRVAARSLSAANYRVDVASSGETAVERFRAHMSTLVLVLMDINLPGISGIDATEQIRRLEADAAEAARAAGTTPRPPVLILGLTGNVDEANLRLYESAGMDGCIGKGRQLGDAVKQALRMHRAHPNLFVDLSGAHPTAAPAPVASPIPVPADENAPDPTAVATTNATNVPSCPCGSPRGVECPCRVGCVCSSVCHAPKRARFNPADSHVDATHMR